MLFDQFKQYLRIAVSDRNFIAQNTLAQNNEMFELINNRIASLTPDVNIKLRSEEIVLTSGLVHNDILNRKIKLETGSGKMVLGWLERNLDSTRKIWIRTSAGSNTTPPDGRRYWISDSEAGVSYFSDSGELIGAVPGLNNIAGNGYSSPSSAVTFVVDTAEYVAIACPSDEVVRIFNTSDFSLVSEIGSVGVAGTPDAGFLSEPNDLAWDSDNNILFISCPTEIAPSGTDNGYIASFDISDPTAPTFIDFVAVNNGSKLLHGGVDSPTSIFWDQTKQALWTVSGLGTEISPYEVGAISVNVGEPNGFLVGYLETTSLRRPGNDGRSTYTLTAIGRIHLKSNSNLLYLANENSVEVFDTQRLTHVRTFGEYTRDESSTVTSRKFSISFDELKSVAADLVPVNGMDLDVFLAGDEANRRIIRISENVYSDDNIVLFEENNFIVPVKICGYLVRGELNTENVTVEYRTSPTSSSWRKLDMCSGAIDNSTYFQFRAKFRLNPLAVIEEQSVSSILVIGEQA